FFFSSRRRHTRSYGDWSSDVCSSDLGDIVTNGKDHDSWRKQFFDPLTPIARSIPWVSTIGNHESDSENYFSYMALPGNERYFDRSEERRVGKECSARW